MAKSTRRATQFMNLGRYYHTLRHLRPIQFYGRIAHRLVRPRPDLRPAPPLRAAAQPFPLPPVRKPSLLGPARFRFLNVERELEGSAGWNDPAAEKLWLYNLHYFDDLNAEGRDGRDAWHRALIERWIAENPPGHGNGWEPYPLSLRIVNWTKWALSGHALSPAAMQSLAVQTRFLARRLEWHLLGNHLWTNGKALVFAGAFFDGEEAARGETPASASSRHSSPSRCCRTAGTSSAVRCTTRSSSRICSTSWRFRSASRGCCPKRASRAGGKRSPPCSAGSPP
jgi:hypothetical protein